MEVKAELLKTESSESLLTSILETEQKQLRYARLRLIVAIVIAVTAIIALITLFLGMRYVESQIDTAVATLTNTATKLNEVTDQLNEVDYEELETAFHTITDVGTETLLQIQEELDALKTTKDLAETTLQQVQEEFEALKPIQEEAETVLQQMQDALTKINEMDFDTLSDAIVRFNNVLKPLGTFFGSK